MAASVLGSKVDEWTVRDQLVSWFGPEVRSWELLKIVRIAHAQPEPARLPFPPGLFVCGDHRESSSIQGALLRAGGRPSKCYGNNRMLQLRPARYPCKLWCAGRTALQAAR